jgi:hypothetical protein
MRKEEQIEEMAKEISAGLLKQGQNWRHVIVAEHLYNAGYRKQIDGEWEKVRHHRECSKCHYRAPYKKIKNGYFLQDLTLYCPNCGAKMKGGE